LAVSLARILRDVTAAKRPAGPKQWLPGTFDLRNVLRGVVVPQSACWTCLSADLRTVLRCGHSGLLDEGRESGYLFDRQIDRNQRLTLALAPYLDWQREQAAAVVLLGRLLDSLAGRCDEVKSELGAKADRA
jgi:hypothetical protein